MTDFIGGVDEMDGFPVSDYYKGRVKEARTISRIGPWWSAILLIEDPKTEKPFLVFYRWQKRKGSWKVTKSFSVRSKKDALKVVEFVNELLLRLN